MSKKVALVTGGTGGIGSAICQRFTREYQVVATYYKQGQHELAKLWQAEQAEAGFDIDIVYANIACFEDCKRAVTEVIARYARIDVLVNNAGLTRDISLKNMTPAQWQDVMDANLTSVYNMTRQVIPLMLERNFGRIISIASVNGEKGQFGQCNYAASKAALYGFSKSLAQEVARHCITVNTVSPGYTDTPMLRGLKPEVLEVILASIPLGRLARPEEVAASVAFLASEEAGFITGANIDINGGQHF